MVSNLVKRVNDKIENEKLLYITTNYSGAAMNDAVVPDFISAENGDIYLEGENLIFHITKEKDFQVSYDKIEDEFIIKQGDVTYYIS